MEVRWNTLQETVSVRVLRITGGHDMTFLPAEELTAAMTRAGLQVTVDRRVDQGRPHPHHPLVGRAATWQPHLMAPSPVPRGLPPPLT